jgi:DedD protein
MAAPDDANLDDLRRRARRRLVGAIVLALAVAVFVPMLLESDPKPLGEDVAVKIPPVDDGKFVNKLNDKVKPEPPKALAKAEPRTEAPKPAPAEPPKAEAQKDEPPPKAEAPKEEPRKAEPPAPAQAPATAPARSPREARAREGSRQRRVLGAGVRVLRRQGRQFARQQAEGARLSRLQRAGEHEPRHVVARARRTVSFTRGANAARDKLKGEGYNGIVASASRS